VGVNTWMQFFWVVVWKFWYCCQTE